MAAILIWQNSIVIAAIMVGKQRIMQNEKLIHSFSKTKDSKTKGKVVILNVLKFPVGHKNHGLLGNISIQNSGESDVMQTLERENFCF